MSVNVDDKRKQILEKTKKKNQENEKKMET